MKVSVECSSCHKTYHLRKASLRQYYIRNNSSEYTCLDCKNKARSKGERKTKTCIKCGQSYQISRKTKVGKGNCRKCWQAERTSRATVVNCGRKVVVSDESKSRISSAIKEKYAQDEGYRKAQFAYRDQSWRDKISASIRSKWSNGDYEEVRKGHNRDTWLQRSFRMLCESLGIEYAEEYVVDSRVPYSFDFKVGNILIELDGDYWHSLRNVAINDRQKDSWIRNNHPEFKLIRIKEHEAKCVGKLYKTVIAELDGVRLPSFKLSEVRICQIDRSLAVDFLNAYHYIGKPRPGGLAVGGFVGSKLIAVVLFQRPIRQQSATSSGSSWDRTYEISRLVVAPGYNKKNLVSYLLSRTMRLLPEDVELVISYADSAYGHDGACYKASNFKLERIVRPGYHYERDGLMMHKKTLWDHAMRMKKSERNYAIENGYKKVLTTEKLKFVFKIRVTRNKGG